MSSSATIDWSRLPSDLLESIAGKLPDISDCVRFRAVCSSWRASFDLTRFRAPLPWFLIPSSDPSNETFEFYSLSNNKTYSLNLSGFPYKHVFGSTAGGFLISFSFMYPDSVLNPLTGARLQLPPLAGMCIKNPYLDLDEFYHLLYEGDSYFKGYFTSSSSSNSGSTKDRLVMVSSRLLGTFAFCHIGDATWTIAARKCNISSFVYHKRKFILLEESKNRTLIVDVSTLKQAVVVLPVIKRSSIHQCYLVESTSGVPLLVIWYKDYNFKVFWLDFQSHEEDQRWIEMSQLDHNLAIFLDVPRAFSLRAMDDCSGVIKGNCIYFVESSTDCEDNSLCVFDMEERSIKNLQCSWSKRGNAIAWRRGTWITPSFI